MALTKISTAMWNSVPHHLSHDFNVDDVLFVDVSENKVGIGTTSPTAKLEINPSSGDADLILSSNGTQTLRLDQNSIRTTTTNDLTLFTNGNSNQLVLDSGGNIGIGTNSPSQKLDVVGRTLLRDKVFITGGNYSESDLYILNTNNVNTGVGYAAKVIGVNIKDAVGSANEVYLRSNTGGLTSAGAIYLSSDSTAPNQGVFGVLGGTGAANTQLTHFFTINDQGNVGIGATSPTSKLEIKPTTTAGAGGTVVLNRAGDRSTLQSYYVINSTGYGDELYMGVGANSSDVSIGARHGSISFQTGSYAERLNINTSGNVVATVDMRAPIFYDSDNTGYYLDPNSTSNVVNIAMNGELRLHSYGSTTFLRGSGDAANYTNQNVVLSGWNGLGLYNPTTGGVLPNQTTGFYDFRNGIFDVKGSFRAPIFYDSDNTAFYVDPTSTSVISSIWSQGAGANSAPRWDTSFHVVQSQHWYGHTSTQTMYAGESTSDVIFRGQVAIGGTAIQSGYALTMTGSIDLNNGSVDYISQLHFNDNVRFYDDGNDSYLNFKWGDTGPGGIKFVDGDGLIHGYVYGDGGGGFGLLDKDGNWALYTNGASELQLRSNDNVEFVVYNSYTHSPGSSRAPIFYDSDNTGYYLDPASTSNLNDLYAYSYQGNGNVGGTGSASWHPSGIYSAGYNWLYGGINGGSGPATNFSDVQANIFYDYNNTGYYGDFASRSIMDSLQLGNASSDTTNLKLDVQGNMAIRGTNGLYYGITTNNYGSWTTRMYASGSTQYFNGQEFRFDNQGYGSTTFGVINASGIHDQRSNTYAALRHSGSDFANGTLVATDIPSSTYAGASFIIEVTGKSYSSTPPFSFIAQGYLYADTIINTSGVNNGDLRLTYIKVMNYNGYLHFWWPRVSYWNSFEVRVRDAGGDVTNRVTSIGNSAEPSGATKVIQINLHQSVTYDTNTNSGALYATTFYNSNDTNARLTANGLVLRGTSPTVYLRDTDQNSAMLHCNSNLFYILRGGNDTESWAQVNGQWPAYWNLTNNNMYAGATGYFIGDVVAYSSDERLKENIKNIDSPLEKLHKINGVTFDWKDEIDELGFVPRNKKNDVGVIAQEVEKILPQVITAAPFDIKEGGKGSKSGKDYKTVQYEKLVPLLIEAVKELSEKVKMLENK